MKKKLLALLLVLTACVTLLAGCKSSTYLDESTDAQDITISADLQEKAAAFVNSIIDADEDGKVDAAEVSDKTVADGIEYNGLDGLDPDRVLLGGWQSWQNNKEYLGDYTGEVVKAEDFKILDDVDNSTYVAIADLSFAKRHAEFRMIFSHQLEATSITFNPEYTLDQKLGQAAQNTVIELVSVFVILIVIMLVIYCFKFIHSWEEKRNQSAAPAGAAPAAAPAETAAEAAEEEENVTDDLELVAVITAAIAASEGTSPDGLVVRSVKRAHTSNWKR